MSSLICSFCFAVRSTIELPRLRVAIKGFCINRPTSDVAAAKLPPMEAANSSTSDWTLEKVSPAIEPNFIRDIVTFSIMSSWPNWETLLKLPAIASSCAEVHPTTSPVLAISVLMVVAATAELLNDCTAIAPKAARDVGIATPIMELIRLREEDMLEVEEDVRLRMLFIAAV